MGEYIGNWSIAQLEDQLHILESGLAAYSANHIEHILTLQDISAIRQVLKRKKKEAHGPVAQDGGAILS